MTMPPVIRLNIDTLMVDDLGSLSPQQLRDAVTSELTRRLTESPPVAQSRSAERLDAGSFRLRAGMGAGAIGGAIAARVHGSLAP
ncbi:hypothetical protein BH23GEM10_BH23GEM10_00190 [soil metagenome]